MGSGAAAVSATASGRLYRGLRDDASLDEQAAWLRERVGELQAEVGELRQGIAEARHESSRQVAEVTAEYREPHAELTARLDDVATGRVRQGMLGLGLVVLGTFISSLG